MLLYHSLSLIIIKIFGQKYKSNYFWNVNNDRQIRDKSKKTAEQAVWGMLYFFFPSFTSDMRARWIAKLCSRYRQQNKTKIEENLYSSNITGKGVLCELEYTGFLPSFIYLISCLFVYLSYLLVLPYGKNTLPQWWQSKCTYIEATEKIHLSGIKNWEEPWRARECKRISGEESAQNWQNFWAHCKVEHSLNRLKLA